MQDRYADSMPPKKPAAAPPSATSTTPPQATPPPQNDSPPPQNDVAEGEPQDSGEGDEQVAKVLWDRVNGLNPQDLQMLAQSLSRQAGLVLLKILPELSAVILQAQQMQGPEMGEVRGAFGHDETMQQMSQKGAAPPQGGQPPQQQPGRMGLRSV